MTYCYSFEILNIYELKENIDTTVYCDEYTQSIFVRPFKKTNLRNALKLKDFVQGPSIFFSNIKSISINSSIENLNEFAFLSFKNSIFRFEFSDSSTQNLFTNDLAISFEEDVVYSINTPILAFENASISYLALFEMTNTSFFRNYLEFEPTNIQLNCMISSVRFGSFKLRISNEI